MTDQHPITPPPKLVRQWLAEAHSHPYPSDMWHIATQAARWGADAELEACCEYMQHEDFHGFATELRAARRPQPQLSLKALEHLSGWEGDADTIRRALEQLP